MGSFFGKVIKNKKRRAQSARLCLKGLWLLNQRQINAVVVEDDESVFGEPWPIKEVLDSFWISDLLGGRNQSGKNRPVAEDEHFRFPNSTWSISCH